MGYPYSWDKRGVPTMAESMQYNAMQYRPTSQYGPNAVDQIDVR